MPNRKFDLTVGKLSPFLDDLQEAATWRLVNNLAGFAARGIKGQREYPPVTAACRTSGLPNRGGERSCRNSKLVKPTIAYIQPLD